MRRFPRIPFPWVLLLAFICGSAAGAAAANALGGLILQQIGYLDSLYRTGTALSGEQKGRLLGYVFCQRAREFGLAVLIGMTPAAAFGFLLICFAGGLGCGLLVSVLTMKAGMFGIFLFFRMVLPQWLLYFPAWAFLAVKSEDGLGKLRMRSWLLPAVLAAAGIFLESYVNPCLIP